MLSKPLALGFLALSLCACAQTGTAPPSSASNAIIGPLDTPIEQIAAAPKGCVILDRDFPRLRAHPMYAYFKAMSLNQIAAMSHGQITPDMLTKARADLSTLNASARVSVAAP